MENLLLILSWLWMEEKCSMCLLCLFVIIVCVVVWVVSMVECRLRFMIWFYVLLG